MWLWTTPIPKDKINSSEDEKECERALTRVSVGCDIEHLTENPTTIRLLKCKLHAHKFVQMASCIWN